MSEIYFREKFAEQVFEISGDRNIIDFECLFVVLEALQIFGHLISKLRINYVGFDADQIRKINTHVNDYCAKSLIHLEIDLSDAEKLSSLKGPFANVKFLELRYGFLKYNESNFDEMFPAVRHLDLGLMARVSGCFEHHFRHLEFLNTKAGWSSTEKLLLLNRQLKHLKLFDGHWDLVRKISEKLTMLESLDLRQFNDRSVAPENLISFENVKSFKFEYATEADEDLPTPAYETYGKIPLTFDHLEEIECFEPLDQWFDVIIRNRNLKKITTGALNDEQICRISEEITQLEELSTDYKGDDSARTIVSIIKRLRNLTIARFRKCDFDKEKVIKQLGSEWKLQKNTFYKTR